MSIEKEFAELKGKTEQHWHQDDERVVLQQREHDKFEGRVDEQFKQLEKAIDKLGEGAVESRTQHLGAIDTRTVVFALVGFLLTIAIIISHFL